MHFLYTAAYRNNKDGERTNRNSHERNEIFELIGHSNQLAIRHCVGTVHQDHFLLIRLTNVKVLVHIHTHNNQLLTITNPNFGCCTKYNQCYNPCLLRTTNVSNSSSFFILLCCMFEYIIMYLCASNYVTFALFFFPLAVLSPSSFTVPRYRLNTFGIFGCQSYFVEVFTGSSP